MNEVTSNVFCTNCGAQITPQDRFCPVCGTANRLTAAPGDNSQENTGSAVRGFSGRETHFYNTRNGLQGTEGTDTIIKLRLPI